MSTVSVLDAVGSVASLAALVAFLWGGRRALRANTRALLFLILLLTFQHDLSNFLEWAGIDAAPDAFEDFFEVLMALLWGVLLYAFMQNMTEKRLREMAEQFQATFEASPDAFILTNMETMRIVDVNRSFTQSTGYTKEEAAGKDTGQLGIWKDPSDREKFNIRFRRDGAIDNVEAVVLARDGREIHALISARQIQLHGVPHLLAIAKDIGSLKEAEGRLRESLREKEVLLKEIHHRVKNNLQVISGMLNLQARYIKDTRGREIYRESQNRIVTMALIHESLYQAPDLAKVDFAAYLDHLARNLFISYGAEKRRIRLVQEIEPVDLVVDTAIPCGLIVNELVTNALKHAFTQDDGGEVSLGFRRRSDGSYELTVADDGSGLPRGFDFSKPQSLGLQLVKVLSEQMNARLDIGRDAGTVFRIVFYEYREAGTVLY